MIRYDQTRDIVTQDSCLRLSMDQALVQHRTSTSQPRAVCRDADADAKNIKEAEQDQGGLALWPGYRLNVTAATD
jgi:hypothetical protein